MKEATGEVSMTVVTLVAIAVIGGILAIMWPGIKEKITGLWGANAQNCPNNQYWNGHACVAYPNNNPNNNNG